jgi:hypothetical protein
METQLAGPELGEVRTMYDKLQKLHGKVLSKVDPALLYDLLNASR